MWSLFDEREGKRVELKPNVFSNGKTQENVVDEVVKEIRKGTKIIFIHGVCGSGKSAIALNIAAELGRASIVVPIKNLQRQYENDYMNKKSIFKKDGKKLRIDVITGRKNHICPYLESNSKELLLSQIREKNANLSDIFSGSKKQAVKDTISCDSSIIPCKIEIKNKNFNTIKKYYQENPEKEENASSELDIKTMKRFAVAPACPYWNPILNSEMKIKNNWQKKEYKSIAGKHSLYLRKDGCPYYAQFQAYVDSDAIIFNGDQYILETAIGRKPLTDVEIIDECDEFLDNFALEGTLNLTRLKSELSNCMPSDETEREILNSLSDDITEIISDSRQYLSEKDNIVEVGKTKVTELIKGLARTDLLEMMAEDSYIEHCVEVARKFCEVLEDSYASFYRDETKNEIFLKLVTINLDKLLNSLIEKNKAFVFMSGTLHSERILKEIFGIRDFKIIEAETLNQGTIKKLKTGLEKDFKFENFNRKLVSREQYLKALDKCIDIAKLPIVVQINAFQDLPNEQEIENFHLRNLISSQELMEQQSKDREGKLVNDFKAGKTKILFTTRCSRGIDFPFETCNSVIISKFPYPNTQSLFWKILQRNKPDIFWEFYRDKAHRELLQRVYRSVRDPRDHVFLLSPDIRVLNSKVI